MLIYFQAILDTSITNSGVHMIASDAARDVFTIIFGDFATKFGHKVSYLIIFFYFEIATLHTAALSSRQRFMRDVLLACYLM